MSQFSPQFEADRVLRLFEYVPEGDLGAKEHGIFVIGVGEASRLTVASQQVRALRLINALWESGRLAPRERNKPQQIAIIGGGVAGCMAAVKAARLKVQVTLFEKRDEVLSMFKKASHRHLYPGLFDWPQPGWNAQKTLFGHLDWTAGKADKVAAEIKDRFSKEVRDSGGRLRVVASSQCTYLGRNHEGVWLRTGDGRAARFDHLILATGFGIETDAWGSKPYWEPDDLDGNQKGKDFYIVGCGDGGLADCLRLCVENFDDKMAFLLLTEEWGKSDKEQRLKVERDVRKLESSTRQNLPDEELDSFYSGLADHARGAVKWFKEHLRTDVGRVTLVGRGRSAFTSKASPLNRFLVSCVWKAMTEQATESLQPCRLRFVEAEFEMKDRKLHPCRDSQRQDVKIDISRAHVVIRKGPEAVLNTFCPEIFKYCRATLIERNAVDSFSYARWDMDRTWRGLTRIDSKSLDEFMQSAAKFSKATFYNVNISFEEWFQQNLQSHLLIQESLSRIMGKKQAGETESQPLNDNSRFKRVSFVPDTRDDLVQTLKDSPDQLRYFTGFVVPHLLLNCPLAIVTVDIFAKILRESKDCLCTGEGALSEIIQSLGIPRKAIEQSSMEETLEALAAALKGERDADHGVVKPSIDFALFERENEKQVWGGTIDNTSSLYYYQIRDEEEPMKKCAKDKPEISFEYKLSQKEVRAWMEKFHAVVGNRFFNNQGSRMIYPEFDNWLTEDHAFIKRIACSPREPTHEWLWLSDVREDCCPMKILFDVERNNVTGAGQ